jgi:hypothetical protein
MSKTLARPRPNRDSEKDRSRVVFVRQPVKQLPRETGQDHLFRYIFITSSVVIALAAFLAALGAIGSTLGFEDGFGLPRRSIDTARSFVDGISMIAFMPDTILRAGEGIVLLPVVGFFWVGIPSAMLTLARPRVPGAPLPDAGSRALASTGGAIACAVAVATAVWCMLSWRQEIVTSDPASLSDYNAWRDSLDIVAGADIFLFIGLALWCVLGFRLGLPRWGRVLTCVTLLVSITMMFAAMSVSSGIIKGLDARRPVVAESGSLLVGQVGASHLLLSIHPDRVTSSLDAGNLEFSGMSSLSRELALDSVQTDEPRP